MLVMSLGFGNTADQVVAVSKQPGKGDGKKD